MLQKAILLIVELNNTATKQAMPSMSLKQPTVSLSIIFDLNHKLSLFLKLVHMLQNKSYVLMMT